MLKKDMDGYLGVAAYILATSGSTLAINHFENTIAPFPLTFVTFLLALVLFNFINIKNVYKTYTSLMANKKIFFIVNILTLIIWTSTFWGLKFIQPSIFISLFMCFVPIFSFMIKKDAKIKRQVFFMLCTMILTITLIITEYLRAITYEPIMFMGFSLAVISAYVSAIYIVYTSNIQRTMSISTIELISTRFYLLVIFSLILSISQHNLSEAYINLKHTWYDFILIAAVSTIIPVYGLQKAIVSLGPIRTPLLMTITPICTYILQVPFGFKFNFIVMALILILSCLLAKFYYILYAHADR